jgi:hypothetical protein
LFSLFQVGGCKRNQVHEKVVKMLAFCVNSQTLVTHLLMQNGRYIAIKQIALLPKSCSCVCSRNLSMNQIEKSDIDSNSRSKKSHRQNCNFLSKSGMFFLQCNAHSSSSRDNSYQVKVQRKVGTLAATLVNNSAASLQPYMKLMRIDKPIGTNPFYWTLCLTEL